MSKVAIKGAETGTGVFTLESPATNTDRTLVLPDSTTTLVGTDAAQTLTNKTIQGGALTSATAVSASGTSVDFTSIPSWVKRITVMFAEVSLSGIASVDFQVGSGSLSTSGYLGSRTSFTSSTMATVQPTGAFATTTGSNAAGTINGSIVLTHVGGNIWTANGAAFLSNTTRSCIFGGSITLSGVLDLVSVVSGNGTDTFDAGTINIMYEG